MISWHKVDVRKHYSACLFVGWFSIVSADDDKVDWQAEEIANVMNVFLQY